MDNPIVWIAIAVGAVLAYLLVMRVFARDSKEADKKVDMSKMKPWKDDD
jgi:uncharacterized membrane protein YdjX (TVP38/TMEM64 family)